MKKLKNTVKIFLLFIVFLPEARAQDPQFSQFYSAPLYLNPAFTGANVCARVSTNVRNQWPGIPNGYITEQVGFDHYSNSAGLGLGVLFTNDHAGSGKLKSTAFSGLVAYEFIANRNLGFRVGFQAGGVIRSVNFNDLLFGDQIARGGNVPTVIDPTQTRAFVDFSTGFLTFTKKSWIGISIHHITQPNESLLDDEAFLPRKFSLHGGTKILLRGEESEPENSYFVTPAFNFRSQAKFDQLDLGCYFSYKIFNAGLWYRGIPVFKEYKKGYPNNDALALLGGLTIDRFNIGYSFDLTISWLRGNTSGAHELSLSYQFCKLTKKRRKVTVSCPKF